MYLVVGLGNPGREYENTRHNIGFRAIDEIAARIGVTELKFKTKCNAMIGEGRYEDHRVILAQPQTFMNLSGEAVSSLISWYKIPFDHLIVIHDDVDIEPGEIRVKSGGGTAGHHGIESIMERTGTADFIRVRVGIGRPCLPAGRERGMADVTDYVLGEIPPSEAPLIDAALKNAADSALSVVTEGLEAAKKKFNGMKAE